MQNYRNGKWVDQILSQRREDGLWGNFHTLSCPVPGRNYTTEQAIRRLYYLGYTAEDEVIHPVLKRMEQCITGELDIDSYSEKKHDWVFFENSCCRLGCEFLSHKMKLLLFSNLLIYSFMFNSPFI